MSGEGGGLWQARGWLVNGGLVFLVEERDAYIACFSSEIIAALVIVMITARSVLSVEGDGGGLCCG
jgi:hypothetical protein